MLKLKQGFTYKFYGLETTEAVMDLHAFQQSPQGVYVKLQVYASPKERTEEVPIKGESFGEFFTFEEISVLEAQYGGSLFVYKNGKLEFTEEGWNAVLESQNKIIVSEKVKDRWEKNL